MTNESGVTTRDVIRALCSEMNLLMTKKITHARANASARLAIGVLGMANLEVVHHKMKPARGQSVRPVVLVGQTHEAVQALPDKRNAKKKRK